MRKVNYTVFPEWFIEDLYLEEDKEKARCGFLPHSSKVLFLCTLHGAYSQRVSNHINFKTLSRVCGCPECGKIQRVKKKKETHNKQRASYPDWFINELAYREDKERAKNKSISSGELVSFICPTHGVYKQAVYHHIRLKTGEKTGGCPKCAYLYTAKNTRDRMYLKRPDFPGWFIEEIYLENDKEKARNKELTYRDKISFYCKEHGVYEQVISDHIDYKTGNKKQGCPKCGVVKRIQSRKENNRNNRPAYPSWFMEELAHEDDRIKALNKDLNWSDKIDFVCPIHGIYTQRVDAHIHLKEGTRNQGCPSCSKHLSKNEDEIYEFVKSLVPDIERRNRSLIKEEDSEKFLELDIYIPSKKVAIEYNGSYWHGELNKKDNKIHLRKYQLCERQGIRLISIYDRDWKENKEKIKTFLKDLFFPKVKIYGRCVEIHNIPIQEAKSFYNEYHLKGSGCHNKVSYGLFYKKELVSGMSFSKPNFGYQKNIEWDLTRYCVKPGYSVIGGAENLFKTFLEEYSPKSIVTYSDNDYFTGEIYARLGFQLDKITTIPYYWAKSDRVFLDRQLCQVKKLKERYPDLYDQSVEKKVTNKEEYIMHELGFYKVYRSGNKKWIYSKGEVHVDSIQSVDSKSFTKLKNTCGNLKKISIKKEKPRKIFPQWFIEELARDEDKERALEGGIVWSEKLQFYCPVHGQYTQRVDAHIHLKEGTCNQGCPKCGRIKQIKSRKENYIKNRPSFPQWFIEDLARDEDKERAKRGEIVTSEYLDFICPIHGVYNQYVGNHINYCTGEPACKCPLCGQHQSLNESEIFNFVKSLCPDVEERNRDTVLNEHTGRFFELDIYSESKKIAIEYNGSLWHGERFKKNNDYHLTKFKLCEDKGIHLFSIFDKDWIEHKDKIKSLIKDFVLPKVKVFGRNTVIKQVSLKEAKNFYNTYHLKNNDNSYTITYGLYYNGVLISCMSFSKPKFGKQKYIEWDLSRYCTKFGYVVLGGAKKLFTAFLKEYKPTSIITYSDNDYFTGNIYRELGFSFVNYTDIPYYWAKDNTFLTRQQCQVKVLKEKYPYLYQDSLTKNVSNKEDYIMHKLGYYKVYRCGNKKWIWTS